MLMINEHPSFIFLGTPSFVSRAVAAAFLGGVTVHEEGSTDGFHLVSSFLRQAAAVLYEALWPARSM